jgi:hypothetical protein
LYEDPDYYGEDVEIDPSFEDQEINTHLTEEEDVYNPHATINS